MADLRHFELLNGEVRASVNGVWCDIRGVNGWVLAALLLDGFVLKSQIKKVTGLSDEAIRKVIQRARDRAGLTFTNDRSRGWSLDRTGLMIDAIEFLDLVEECDKAPDESRATNLARARALWRSGPPRFDRYGPPAPEIYRRLQRAHDRAMASGRRILVIDDQIAEAVANALRTEHVCETATSFAEFRAVEPRLGDFDLVVVDRRLRLDAIDSSGDLIAERINDRSDAVPVLMMTLKLPTHVHLDDWEMKLGLAGVVLKEKDGGGAEVDKIAARINEVIREGPTERACSAIEASMVRYRRQARKQLEDGRSPEQAAPLVARMDDEAKAVVERATTNDLAGARLRRGAFLRNYRLG